MPNVTDATGNEPAFSELWGCPDSFQEMLSSYYGLHEGDMLSSPNPLENPVRPLGWDTSTAVRFRLAMEAGHLNVNPRPVGPRDLSRLMSAERIRRTWFAPSVSLFAPAQPQPHSGEAFMVANVDEEMKTCTRGDWLYATLLFSCISSVNGSLMSPWVSSCMSCGCVECSIRCIGLHAQFPPKLSRYHDGSIDYVHGILFAICQEKQSSKCTCNR